MHSKFVKSKGGKTKETTIEYTDGESPDALQRKTANTFDLESTSKKLGGFVVMVQCCDETFFYREDKYVTKTLVAVTPLKPNISFAKWIIIIETKS